MTIDEKVRKTLTELGVTDATGVEALFARSARHDGTGEGFPDYAGRDWQG